MSAASYRSTSSDSSLSTLCSCSEASAISENLNCLIDKINQIIQCNFFLRGYLIDDLSSINKEKLITWISSPVKKFQNLDEDTSSHFAVPDVVDHLFEQLKTSIQQASIRVSDREKYFEDCVSLIKEKSININPPVEDYSWTSLKTPLSEIFKEAIDSLLNQPEVQALNSNVFVQKLKQLFRSMEEISTAQMICNNLASIFELSRDRAMDIAYLLAKDNPFHYSLTDILLNDPLDLIGLNLCFLEHGKIHTIKVEKIHVEEPSNTKRIFTLIGKNQKAVLTVDRLLKLLTTIVWQTEKEDNLASLIRSFEASGVRICEIGRPCDGAHEDWGKWLPAGEYTVESLSKEEQGASINEREKCFKTFHFIPTSSSSAKALNSISFGLFLDENSKEIHFILRRGAESRECLVHFDWFCRFFPVKIREAIHVDIASHQQNDIYITQTELFTNELLIEKLKQRSVAEKAIIDHLKKIDLNPILESLIIDWPCQEDLLRKDGKVLHSLKNLFCSQKLRDLVFTICEVDETSLDSLEEFNLLLNYVFRANIEQIVPNLDLSEGSDLIKMLGNSLKTSKELKGKRGVAILGETGSGKSTTTCFLIGAEMEEYVNRFGKICMRVAGSARDSLSQLPEIGFSLGISKTTFTQGFRLINVQENIKIGRKTIPGSKLNFPLYIDQNQFLVVDFPGFYDTRGTEYEIITSFTIDHGILSLQALDAVIQVLPYDLITSRKSVFFINALRELSARFEGAFQDPILSERIFFLITKQDTGVGVEQLRERALELVNEDRSGSSPDPEKCALLTFFTNQCQKGRVFASTPMARSQRIDILNKVLETPQQPQEERGLKECYQLSLDSPEMKVKFADILNKSVSVWKDTILPQFLVHSKNGIEEVKVIINEMLTEQELFTKEVEYLNQNFDILIQESSKSEKFIELLKGSLMSLDPISVELLLEMDNYEQQCLARIEKDIENLQNQELRLSNEENQLQKRLESQCEQLSNIDEKIHLKNQMLSHTIPNAEQKHFKAMRLKQEKVTLENQRIFCEQGMLATKDRLANILSKLRFVQNMLQTKKMHDIFTRLGRQMRRKEEEKYPYSLTDKSLLEAKCCARTYFADNEKIIDDFQNEEQKLSNKASQLSKDLECKYKQVNNTNEKIHLKEEEIKYLIPNIELDDSKIMDLKREKAMLEGERKAYQEQIRVLQGEIISVQYELTTFRERLRKHKISDIISRLCIQVQHNKTEQESIKIEIENSMLTAELRKKNITVWSKYLEALVFQRKRLALFIRTHASHLENAVKMAEFFISLKPTRSRINAIDAKESGIIKGAQAFLDFYQSQKEHLEQELNDLGLLARIQRS